MNIRPIRNKLFKIIPEKKIVKGEMAAKGIEKDLRRGIKPIARYLISCLYVTGSSAWNDVNIKATAYCDEKDEYDENVGIDVCSAKLEMKNHKKLARLYEQMYECFLEAAATVYTWRMEHNDKARAIEDDLAKTYGRRKE